MLDQNVRIVPELIEPRARQAERVFSFRDILRFARLRQMAILVPLLTALAIAYGYMQIAIPVYSARSQIIIDPRLPQFIPGHNEETVLAWDSAQVESEIAVLQSERIAAAVVTKLGLDRDKDFREWPSPFDRLKAFLGLDRPPADAKPDRFRDALLLIESGLSVRRTGLSYAIDVSFSFPEAFRTSEIANAIAEAYIADQIDNRSQAARLGGDWLQNRMVLLRSQMNTASQAVQAFRASHNYAIARQPASDADQPPSGAGNAATSDKSLDELEASANTYRRIYESFLQSYTESVQRQSFPVSDARILTPASLPKVKSAPRALLIYALAGLIGLLAGLGIAVLQHNLDQTIRLSRQVTALLPIDDLGSLPLMRRRKVKDLLRAWMRSPRSPASHSVGAEIQQRMRSSRRRWWRGRRPYFTAALERPISPFGSALFGTKTLLDLVKRRDGFRSIGVAAPHRNGGTSTIASNLASLAAASGTKTLIIDADLVGRSLTRRISGARGPGLLGVLDKTASLDEAVVPLGGANLSFLPASAGPGADLGGIPAESLDSLLQDALDRYALVIVDLPPLFPVGPALDLCASLDGVVLTVESGRTSADLVCKSAEYLARVHARTLGFVLNKAV